MDTTKPKNIQHYPEMWVQEEIGWDMFSPEVSWFIYDFFRFDLNTYEKLIFYSYFVNGMTFMQIADSADCTFQNIGITINKIEKKIHNRWKTKKDWKVNNDSQHTDKRNSGRNKTRSKSRS